MVGYSFGKPAVVHWSVGAKDSSVCRSAEFFYQSASRKMALQRAYQTIGGSCQWYAAAVVENQGRYRDALISEYHKYPALIPVFDFMDDKAPGKVRKMKKVWTEDGYILLDSSES